MPAQNSQTYSQQKYVDHEKRFDFRVYFANNQCKNSIDYEIMKTVYIQEGPGYKACQQPEEHWTGGRQQSEGWQPHLLNWFTIFCQLYFDL